MGCTASKKKEEPPAPTSSFLTTAANDKLELDIVYHPTLSLCAAMCKMQGWRVNQEDMAVAHCGLEGSPDTIMCGVFDGHSGGVSSSQAAKKIWPCVLGSKEWEQGDTEAALIRGFLEFDTRLRKMQASDGTTAVCALVTDTVVWVANCGDSRAVLCRGGMAVALSVDHKPNLPEETQRIRRAGGFVDVYDQRCPRVMAPNCYMAMATSRSLGDFAFKNNRHRPQDEQIVSPKPAITKTIREPTDEFLILASDGVWDVMSSQEACTFLLAAAAAWQEDIEKECAADSQKQNHVNDATLPVPPAGQLRPGRALEFPSITPSLILSRAAAPPPPPPNPLKRVCEDLLRTCLAKGTMDNCTVVIVDLRGPDYRAAPSTSTQNSKPSGPTGVELDGHGKQPGT